MGFMANCSVAGDGGPCLITWKSLEFVSRLFHVQNVPKLDRWFGGEANRAMERRYVYRVAVSLQLGLLSPTHRADFDCGESLCPRSSLRSQNLEGLSTIR